MASKAKQEREARRAIKPITSLCMRCPDPDTAFNCPAAHDENLSGCIASHGSDNLWPGFQSIADSVSSCKLDLTKSEVCTGLLRRTTKCEKDKFVAAKKGSNSPQDLFNNLRDLRGGYDCTFDGANMSITKNILSAAYNTLYPGADDEINQKVGELTIGSSTSAQAPGDRESMSSHDPKDRGKASESRCKLEFAKKPANLSDKTSDLITNHFRLKLDSEKTLYEYQISGLYATDGRELSSLKKNTIIRRLIAASPELDRLTEFAFNSEGKLISWKNLHSKLAVGNNNVIVGRVMDDYDRTSTTATRQLSLGLSFQREFTFKGLNEFVNGSFSDYEEVGLRQALDILIGNNIARMANSKIIQIGDNKFFPIGNNNELELSAQYGLVALRGFSSHATPVDKSVTLNVNTAFSAFYKQQTVQKYIDHKVALDHLLHVRVRILYDRCKVGEADKSKDTEARRTKTITGFSKLKAHEIMFKDRNKHNISVYDHFVKEYPSAKSRSRNEICVNTSDAAAGKQCWFLADQLEVLPGQLYRGTLDKISPELTASMISFACQSPETNRQSIQTSGLQALGLDNGTPQLLSDAGITFDSRMMRIPFRRIKPPKVSYKNGNAEITDGAWTTSQKQFWTITRPINGQVRFFSTIGNSHMQPHYIACFRQMYDKNGIKINTRLPFVDGQVRMITDFSNPTALSRSIEGVGLAVLILPEDNAVQRPKYAAFRVAADQILGRPSLVLSEKRMRDIAGGKPDPVKSLVPYMAQNMMKVNTRLGNSNHRVEAFSTLKETLVLGADLVHPKQSNPADVPSIASLVGSMDNHFDTFYGSSRRNPHRVEIIDRTAMVEMATERIRAWREANNRAFPKQILYYRDGTGSSQYGEILEKEVPAILDAFENLHKKFREEVKIAAKVKPRITAIVVVKRHTTRFYPTVPTDKALALKENCLPGTVVDTDITSPYYFDFYLQSHTIERSVDANNKPKYGSAKPTHYFVLVDENGYTAEALQNITNAFCYNFSHSTTPISYASPAYLADRLCDRVTLYLKRWYDHGEDVQVMSVDQRRDGMDSDWKRGGQVGRNIWEAMNPWNAAFNKVMFWM